MFEGHGPFRRVTSNRIGARLSGHRQKEHPRKAVHLPLVSKLFQADGHPLMALFRLPSISAEKEIPPRQIEAEVAVCLAHQNGVVDAVHIWRHKEYPQHTV